MSDENNDPPPPAAAPAPAKESGARPALPVRVVSPGDVVVGRIVKITGSVAFVDYGARNEGYIELGELRDEAGEISLSEGDEVEAEVVGTRGAVRLSYKKAKAAHVLETLKGAWKEQRPVSAKVVGLNKGGYEMRVDGVRAFCPNSQIGEHFVREPMRLVGQSFDFLITEFDGRSVVLSRRLYLERKKAEVKDTIAVRYRSGDRLQGRVTQLREFGAFVELEEGVEGMIHISEISHQRIEHPSARLTVGDAVEVEVIKVDAERGRVGLSIKALESDPVSDFVDGLEVGATLTGTVARLQPFGAFVNIGPGVDGLLHVSGISAERRIEHPSEVYSEGDSVEVVVEKIDRRQRKIGLLTPEVAEARQPVEITVKVGDVVKGPVTRVERYGVFVEVGPKVIGLVPNAEMATARGSDHSRMFPLGTELEVKVLEVDRGRNRIRLSRKALQDHNEREAFLAHQKSQGVQGMGTLGDLLGKDFFQKK